MTMIPAFGPWPEHPADADEEKRLASAQQSKTSPISIDKEHETGVFYGSGKDPYQTSLASCTCNDFVRRKKPCKHVFRLAMELGIIDAAYKTGRSTGERNEAQLSFADCLDLVEQLSDAAQNEIKGCKSRKPRVQTTPDGAASALTKRLLCRMIVRTGRKNTLAILCVSVSSISPATTPSI